MSNEEDGSTALTAGDQMDAAGATAPISPDRINGRFAPGWKGGPGRPKRGESVPEKLRAKVERHGDKVVNAAFNRLLREDSVGNRAFADMRDTVYGIPKQTLVVENAGADAAIDTLLARFVDAEYKLLPDTDTLHT